MQVENNYHLPFDTPYDWRVSMIQVIVDLTVESAVHVIKDYEEHHHRVDWDDVERVLSLALSENIFHKVSLAAVEKATRIIS